MHNSALNVPQCIKKLKETSELIQLRGDLEDQELRRVKDAIELLDEIPVQGKQTSMNDRRRNHCRELLSFVNREFGRSFVILCAVALGSANVGRMKKNDRLRLRSAMQAEKDSMICPALYTIEQTYMGEPKTASGIHCRLKKNSTS